LGIGSAITLTSYYGDFSVPAGKFLYDTYGASLGIIKGNTTIDNYMAKAAAVNGSLSSTVINAATYKGTWNAFSNTPTLTNGVGTIGDAYDTTVDGTGGAFPAYGEQDWRIYDGSVWQRVAKTTTTQWTIKPAVGGLADKEARQIAKLDIALAKRQGKVVATNGTITGSVDPTKPYYRVRNNYDITQLPTQYDGNAISDNANVGGLVQGRPWVSVVNPAPVTEDLILFFDSERTDCYSGTGTTIYNLVDGTPSTLFGDITYSNGTLRISNTDTPIAGNRISGIQCQTVTGFKTISLWYKQITDSAGYYSYIVDARTGMPGGWIYDTPSNDYFGESWASGTMFIDGGPSQQPNYTQQLNVWRNVTFVTDGTAFTDDITLFSRYTQTEGLDVEFGACMIYSRAITEAENKQNYDQFKTRYPSTTVTSGLRLYLDAGNAASYSGSGTTWTDLSANTNDATLVGSPTFTSAGTSSYFTFPNDSNKYATTSHTKYGGTYTGKTTFFVARMDAGIADGYHGIFGFNPGRTFNTYIYKLPGPIYQIHASFGTGYGWSDNLTLTTGQWFTFGATQAADGNFTYYFNGQAVGVGTTVQAFANTYSSGTDPQLIGKIDSLWHGDIALVTVYDRTLSGAEMLQNHNAILGRYGL
jgi:hypothetical protein